MQIRLYLDEDAMDDDLVQALRLRGVEVETALGAGMISRPDDEHLAYANSVQSVLYTFNVRDFMLLHNEWLLEGKAHSGIIFGDQQRYRVGEQMRRLRRIIAIAPPSRCRAALNFSACGDD
jgi:hypothetical protein